jgi:acetyl-CoA carboxylase biotin carboxyl carrier protein
MQFSTQAVRDLARLLNESGLHEIAIETRGDDQSPLRITVRGALPQAFTGATGAPVSTDAALPAVEVAANETIEVEVPDAEAQPVFVAVTATAVGLFRHSATPLQIGDSVKKGQVVGAVESMKIPNEVAASTRGRVSEILAEEGQGVEYGQPLLMLEVEDA